MFAGSNPAEETDFNSDKNPQHDFLLKRSKPPAQDCNILLHVKYRFEE
jgi:hypothetical protein